MITAVEAKQITLSKGHNLDRVLSSLDTTIRELSSKGKFTCVIGVDHINDLDFWIQTRLAYTNEFLEAKHILEQHGFLVHKNKYKRQITVSWY